MTSRPASSAPISPLSFDQAWTLEDTRAMYEHSMVSPDFSSTSPAPQRNAEAENAWRATYMAQCEALGLAIARHLAHLAQTQGLECPPHSQLADTRFTVYWNRLAQGEELTTRQAEILGSLFIKPLTLKLIDASPSFASADKPAPSVEQVHDHFLDTVLTGNFPLHHMEREQCQTSGLHLTPLLKNWSARMVLLDPAARKFRSLEENDIASPQIQHATIPVPSGKLLVADWFRDDAFTELFEQAKEGIHSIGSVAAREELTQRIAQQLGVAHVYVGNSCPSVVADEQGVRVGWLADDQKALDTPSVCTDLWWTTMVDKQVLIDLLARTMPVEEASRQVDELIATQASDVIELDMAPGTYHLYFSGEPALFKKLINHDGVDWDGFDDPMLVLSAQPLAPKVARGGLKP